MASKDIEIIQGDSFTMGIRVYGNNGPVDFSGRDVRLYAHVTDMSGRRVLAKFKIIPVDMENGTFRVHLDPARSSALRGKNLWSIRYEVGDRTTTLAGGQFNVKVGAS